FCYKGNPSQFLEEVVKYQNPNTKHYIVKLYVSYFVKQVSQKSMTAELLNTINLNPNKYKELVYDLQEYQNNATGSLNVDLSSVLNAETKYYVLKTNIPIKPQVRFQDNCLLLHHNGVVIDV